MFTRVEGVAQVQRLQAGALGKLDGIVGRCACWAIVSVEGGVLGLEGSGERAGERRSQRRRDDTLVYSVGGMRMKRLWSLEVAGILYKGQYWYVARSTTCPGNSRSCGSHAATLLSVARQALRECRPLTFFQTIGALHCVLSPFSLLPLLLCHCRSSTALICVCGAWGSCLCCLLRLPGLGLGLGLVVLPSLP
jgi:hypothetical protein